MALKIMFHNVPDPTEHARKTIGAMIRRADRPVLASKDEAQFPTTCHTCGAKFWGADGRYWCDACVAFHEDVRKLHAEKTRLDLEEKRLRIAAARAALERGEQIDFAAVLNDTDPDEGDPGTVDW